MSLSPLKADFTDADDTRQQHAEHHNELAQRVNGVLAAFDEGRVGLPAGGEESNVLRVQKRKALGWQGTRMVTPGGRPGMVMALLNRNPARWDWTVPAKEEYPKSRRRVDPDDPESPWFDGPEFGEFQGFWIVDTVDPLGNDQWGNNGDLWMVYDAEQEVTP